ncbi:hypothetical protein EDC56_3246 [Sinobacterium caligoides]|uniref:Curli production assembly/transport component CsgG n=1 Tax=Sinobacterium caligoides TaxID=933926 RepID=A0A3N2DGS2_9GAMM|nr:hypothetical protein [Sinobacterium caligoides]ROR99006.1 hypothetical protein EDC56_3246 [Sinobacterium caligoides]
MRFLKLITVSLLLTTGGCAVNHTTSRTHPTLEQELEKIDSVVIVPPAVDIHLLTLTGENEPLADKQQEIKKELIAIAKQELYSGGYEVVDYDFDQALIDNAELSFVVNQLRVGFDEAKKELRHGARLAPEEASSMRASVGEAVHIVADESGADAVLIMRYVGSQKSDGYIAKDLGQSVLIGVLTAGTVIPVNQTNSGFTEVALIDGHSGDVLWTDLRSGQLTSTLSDKAMDSLPDDTGFADDLARQQQMYAKAMPLVSATQIRELANKAYNLPEYGQPLLDASAQRAWQYRRSEDKLVVDGVAWLTKILANSGEPRYRQVLNQIVSDAGTSKTKSAAKSALKALREGEAEQFVAVELPQHVKDQMAMDLLSKAPKRKRASVLKTLAESEQLSPSVYDTIAKMGWDERATRKIQEAKVVDEVARILAASGDNRYKTLLDSIAEDAYIPALKKNVRIAADKLSLDGSEQLVFAAE